MNKKLTILILTGLLLSIWGISTIWAASITMTNGVTWYDTDENVIHAHGGGLLKDGNYYYWFGENRYNNQYLQFKSVTCYRSTNLKDWEFVNDVLTDQSDSDLNYAKIERPKVIYNASTDKYVMWMHKEYAEDYSEARAAVAISDTVCGDYDYQGSFRPLNYMSRDDTLFVDDDGAAYFISAANNNFDLHIYELTSNYQAIDSLVYQFDGDHREAPAMFKRNGVYFLITSGATGWDPNQGKYAYSTSISSNWSSWQNIGDSKTYDTQPTYVLPVQGSQTTSYLYMGDRWKDPDWFDSKYVWLPIQFNSSTSISLNYHDSLDIDTATGVVAGADAGWAKVDDDHGSISYSSGWGTWSGNPGYQGTEHYSENTGSEVTFTFNGTQARYYGFKRNDLGIADIYVDDVYQTSIDLYNNAGWYNTLIYETDILPSGTHTLEIRVSGNKNSASSGTEIIVDAFSSLNPSAGTPIKVNFQPSNAALPGGYLKDSGSSYGNRGNGETYGWDTNNNNTRDRNNHADQRYDTLNHMQKNGAHRVWEIAVPDGSYTINLVMGDPSYTDQVNNVNIEGVVINDPDGQDNFDVYSGISVTVSDGRLTVQPASGGSNAKINFIDITPN